MPLTVQVIIMVLCRFIQSSLERVAMDDGPWCNGFSCSHAPIHPGGISRPGRIGCRQRWQINGVAGRSLPVPGETLSFMSSCRSNSRLLALACRKP